MGWLFISIIHMHVWQEELFNFFIPSFLIQCSFKLVSAMKGSREAEGGMTPKTKMNVSWAPDVYDPPVTSVSHSVKSYNQRSYFNNKKKDRQHKHKNRKGKGTRDGNNEKKRQQRQSDPSCTRFLFPYSHFVFSVMH